MKKNPMILDHQTAQFVQELRDSDGPPIYTLAPEKARNVLNDLQKMPIEKPQVKIEDISIPGIVGEISLRIVRPSTSTKPLPIVMYFHGGGWILGNKETHDRLIREIAVGADAAVVFVNYSPSPEAHYPIAIEQAYVATAYMAKHGKTHNLDASRLLIAGDSVGGNMTAVVALLAKEREEPDIAHQLLLYPVTDANFETPSYLEFANGPWLTRAAMEWFWDAYLPDKTTRKIPTASPLQASLEQLKGLPPATIIVNEYDPLRDEGEAYAHKLMQAGVPVSAVRLLGTIHDSAMLNPLANTPPVRLEIMIIVSVLRSVFAQ